MQHIREKEWISAGDDMGWFNGYYDNHGNAVEYSKKDEVRMMLTGQVFAVMSKTAGGGTGKRNLQECRQISV